MRETASSELSTHGQVSGQHCQQQQLQCKAADALDSMEVQPSLLCKYSCLHL